MADEKGGPRMGCERAFIMGNEETDYEEHAANNTGMVLPYMRSNGETGRRWPMYPVPMYSVPFFFPVRTGELIGWLTLGIAERIEHSCTALLGGY